MAVLALIVLAVCVSTAGALTIGGQAVDRWPYKTLQLGITSAPGAAASDEQQVPLGFRYQYLSGGVNTHASWQDWGPLFVKAYIDESEAAHVVPVFSYYQIRQSAPGNRNTDESAADLTNIDTRATMRAYFADLKAFFQQAATAAGPVVLQIEPDLWGYIEQAAVDQDASSIPAAVASTGVADLRGMPNTAAGLAQAILVMRNNYAPHVIVAYPDSSWGTELNIQLNHPTDTQVQEMATKSIEFYRSLHAHFTALFTEMSDRDAGYAQNVDGEGTTWWWDPTDFAHLGEYVAAIHRQLQLPIVIWQIPPGNTIMRVMNNTPYHYQDNKVQSLLGTGTAPQALLRSYARDGVAALLFGSGQPTDTCICDNDHNSLSSEPAPIDGNTQRSFSTDDDGGYFTSVARRYYRNGVMRIG